MKLNQIIEILSKKQNGAFIKITWKSDLTKQMTAEAKRQGFIVIKEVTSTVRKGIRGVYKEGCPRNGKYLDITPLQWGNYYRNSRTVIEHRGKYYLKLFLTKNEAKVKYYINGTELKREEFEKYPVMKPSYWHNKDFRHMRNFIILDIDNIEAIY